MAFTIEAGRANGIQIHVARELEVILDETLRKNLCDSITKRASGNFSLAALATEMIRKETRCGGLDLQRKLFQMPLELGKIFNNMLACNKDGDKTRLRMCVVLLLFTRRPLSAREFCHALWAGLSREGFADARMPDRQQRGSVQADHLERLQGVCKGDDRWSSKATLGTRVDARLFSPGRGAFSTVARTRRRL